MKGCSGEDRRDVESHCIEFEESVKRFWIVGNRR